MLKEIEKTLRSHPFVTPTMLQNTHVQIILGTFLPYFTIPTVTPERRLIKIPDGTQLVAECWWQKDKKKHPTVVLLSGFEAYQQVETSRFIKSMYPKAYHAGFNVIHLKQRGEADTIHLTKSIFTTYSGLDDIKIALKTFHEWGLQNVYMIGMSYGGYLLFHTIDRLGEEANRYLSGAVAIATHVGMFRSWKHIEKNPVYNFWLFKSYKNSINRRIPLDPHGTWDNKKLKKIKSKREFMETYMHLFGYPKKTFTLDEYDQSVDVSATDFFSKVNIPLLIINSFDDPMTPIEPYLQPEIQNNPNIITLLPKYGGHGVFFGKKLYGDLDGHWAQNRAMEFIKLLRQNDRT